MNRRRFIGSSVATALAGAALGWPAQGASRRKIGLNLYTVRNELQRDFEGTLARVARTGYGEVEFYGYAGHEPRQVRTILRNTGLVSPSCLVDYTDLGRDWSRVLDTVREVGHQYVVCVWIDAELRVGPDGWKAVADVFNRAGEQANRAGLQFAYHNHNFEFVPVDGSLAYDTLLERTDAHLVQLEMDLCWMSVAGRDPLEYFARYPGRYFAVHVKDVRRIPALRHGVPVPMDEVTPLMVAVGGGVIDFAHLLPGAAAAGVQHFYVEADEAASPFRLIEQSYQFMSRLDF